MRAVLRQPSGALGVALVAAHVLVALLAPLLLAHDPALQDAGAILQPPSAAHWLGTDRLGRDLLSRVAMGGREAMLIATLSALVALVWGGVLGVTLAVVGGWVDAVVMRLVDALISVPWILLVMLFVTVLGTGTAALIPVLGVSYGLSVVYLARGAALDFVARDFVLAAQARGHSRWSVALVEVLPNIRDALAVQGAMQWSWILLAISSLSYLGMGVAPPTPDWGQMIADSRGLLSTAPRTVIAPMLALSSLIIGVNLAVDAAAKALGLAAAPRTPVP